MLKRKILNSTFFIFTIVLFSCQNQEMPSVMENESVQTADKQAFSALLEKHLNAVSQKDLNTLKSTLSPKGDMQLILPSSKIETTTEAFLAMHEEWFQDTSWTFETKIIHTDIGKDLGIAVVEVMYREPDRAGKPYFNKMAVSYALRKEGENWYVVKDHACSLEKSTD